jgi:hypothetical protein
MGSGMPKLELDEQGIMRSILEMLLLCMYNEQIKHRRFRRAQKMKFVSTSLYRLKVSR